MLVRATYLPVFGISGEQLGIFWLTDSTVIFILSLLDFGKGLDPVILGECATMTLSAGMCQKGCTVRLDLAHDRRRQSPDCFEVRVAIVAFPLGWQRRNG
jgi:hypothetical protein